MKIHEYQAKRLFKVGGIVVRRGQLAQSVDEAVAAVAEVGLPCAVKSQVHTGGRGKAGGIKLAKSEDEVRDAAAAILGMDIKGHVVKKLWIEEAADIAREAYLAVTIDRASKSIVIIGSADGGMDIEEVAASTPERILKLYATAPVFPEAEAAEFASALFDGDAPADAVVDVMRKLFDLFCANDCSLAEINPLILTGDGEVVALDGKVDFDDNALFRHPEVLELRDLDEENSREIEAKESGLSFVELDGDIGCMVNGAGLAMGTMDLIVLNDGQPANFLDVGGSSNPEKVIRAFELILSNPKVKAILVNIFGGITRCDDIARGILESYNRMTISVPVIVRLCGTNEEEGLRLLEGTDLIPAESLSQGVKKAVELVKESAA